MHKIGLIHRDIKAENFVFAESPAISKANNRPLVVTIIDLGMAMKYDRKNDIRGVARAQAPSPSHSELVPSTVRIPPWMWIRLQALPSIDRLQSVLGGSNLRVETTIRTSHHQLCTTWAVRIQSTHCSLFSRMFAPMCRCSGFPRLRGSGDCARRSAHARHGHVFPGGGALRHAGGPEAFQHWRCGEPQVLRHGHQGRAWHQGPEVRHYCL